MLEINALKFDLEALISMIARPFKKNNALTLRIRHVRIKLRLHARPDLKMRFILLQRSS